MYPWRVQTYLLKSATENAMSDTQRLAEELKEAVRKASAKGPARIFADAVASGLIHEDGSLNRDYDGLSARAPADSTTNTRR